MARAGYCTACHQEVWLDESGMCPMGHGPQYMTSVRDATPAVQPLLTPAPPQGTRSPLLSTILIVVAVAAFLLCACPMLAILVPIIAQGS